VRNVISAAKRPRFFELPKQGVELGFCLFASYEAMYEYFVHWSTRECNYLGLGGVADVSCAPAGSLAAAEYSILRLFSVCLARVSKEITSHYVVSPAYRCVVYQKER